MEEKPDRGTLRGNPRRRNRFDATDDFNTSVAKVSLSRLSRLGSKIFQTSIPLFAPQNVNFSTRGCHLTFPSLNGARNLRRSHCSIDRMLRTWNGFAIPHKAFICGLRSDLNLATTRVERDGPETAAVDRRNHNRGNFFSNLLMTV